VIPLLINAIGLYTIRVALSTTLTRILGVMGAWIAMFIDLYVRGTTFLTLYIKKFESITRRVA